MSWTNPRFDRLELRINSEAGRYLVTVEVHWDYGHWSDWEPPGYPASGSVISWAYKITKATGPDGQDIDPAGLQFLKNEIDNRVSLTINHYHHESEKK